MFLSRVKFCPPLCSTIHRTQNLATLEPAPLPSHPWWVQKIEQILVLTKGWTDLFFLAGAISEKR
jgi:hypothetical protein